LLGLIKLFFEIISPSLVVFFDLGNSKLFLKECFKMLIFQFSSLLDELLLSLMKVLQMSYNHLYLRVFMTHNKITFFFLKILNLCITHRYLSLKGSNFVFMLTFESFPFLLLIFDEKVMGTSLILELSLFLGKLKGKSFAMLDNTLLLFLKLFEILLE